MTLGKFRELTKNLSDDTQLVIWKWGMNGEEYRIVQPCFGVHPEKTFLITAAEFLTNPFTGERHSPKAQK